MKNFNKIKYLPQTNRLKIKLAIGNIFEILAYFSGIFKISQAFKFRKPVNETIFSRVFKK